MKPTKTLLLGAAACLAVCFTTQAQTLFFDFGGSAPLNGAGTGQQTLGVNYNNLWPNDGANTAALVIANAIDNTGAPTGISVAATNWNGLNTGGTTVPTGAASLFHTNATRDSLFGAVNGFFGVTNAAGSVVFGGLDLSRTYDFTIFASRTGGTLIRSSTYTLTGANSLFASLDAANNTSNVASLTGLIPDALGNITLSVTAAADNDTPEQFYYLGALQMVSVVPEPSSLALSVLGGLGLMCFRRHFRAACS